MQPKLSYSVGWWYWGGALVCLVFAMGLTATTFCLAVRLKPAMNWMLWGTGILWLVVVIELLYGLLYNLLLVRRAYVKIHDAGIAVRTWRGSENSMSWDELEELRVVSVWGHSPRLQLHGGCQVVRVERNLKGVPAVIEAIVRRARLDARADVWWGAVYRRRDG